MNFGWILIASVDGPIYHLPFPAKTFSNFVLYHNKTTTQNIRKEIILIHTDFSIVSERIEIQILIILRWLSKS